jgi:hypothetical protein
VFRDETERKKARARLCEEEQRLRSYRVRLKPSGLADEEIQRVLDPFESFHLQKKEEIEL